MEGRWGKKAFELADREEVKLLMNGYISHEMLKESIEEYIVPPALGENTGIMGQ